MNERIKELLAQAGYKPLPGFDFANSLEEVFLQKFAELIVQECCQFNYDFLESYREACEVNSKIREHFGIE